MPNRSSIDDNLRDFNQLAAAADAAATDEERDEIQVVHVEEKNPHAAALGRLGGKKGGPARAMRLSAARRSEIARLAAQARWHGEQGEQGG